MKGAFDIAITGSGFGGALLALIARRLGRSVILLERGRHPRFAIGESSTPLANLLWERLTDRYQLPNLRPLSKWGSWQKHHPQVGCGLKRGFSFFHHTAGRRFEPDAEHRNQLLVAASSADEVADTHWYRPDFDHLIVREAQKAGVEFIDQVKLQNCRTGDAVCLEGERLGQPVSFKARLVIDATGPRGFLHHALDLPEFKFEHLPATQALFTHFSGVRRLADLGFVPPGQEPPYPVDDAAVHHVFEGGWIWVLRFNNGLTSAGAALEAGLARELELQRCESAWERLMTRFPSIREQFCEATARLPFIHMPLLREPFGPLRR